MKAWLMFKLHVNLQSIDLYWVRSMTFVAAVRSLTAGWHADV